MHKHTKNNQQPTCGCPNLTLILTLNVRIQVATNPGTKYTNVCEPASSHFYWDFYNVNGIGTSAIALVHSTYGEIT